MAERKPIVHYLNLLAGLTGWAALAWLVFVPPTLGGALQTFQSAPQGSVRQLVVWTLAAAAGLTALLTCLAWLAARSGSGRQLPLLEGFFKGDRGRRRQLTALLTLAGGGFFLVHLAVAGVSGNQLDELFYRLIRPLILWGALFCLLQLLRLVLGTELRALLQHPLLRGALAVFAVVFLGGSLLRQLGFGYQPTGELYGNFQLTGYPLLGYQAAAAWLVSLVYLLTAGRLAGKRGQPRRSRWIDLILGLGLFVTAFWLWSRLPVQPHMFYDRPRPPNYEIYPNSDALLYDRTALNLLTAGELQTYTTRYQPYVAKRPLLAVYQAGLHLLAGLDYPQIIRLQTAVFSLLPVLVYLLAASLHSRAAGLLAGLLVIFREQNGILLSDVVTGVHSQLLMSEIPTQMGLILTLFLVIRAVRRENSPGPGMLLAGGCLGLTMLIRQEVGVILPFLALGLLLMDLKNLPRAAGRSLLLLAGMLVAVTPWLIRNYQKSGQIYLDVPGNRFNILLRTLNLGDEFQQEKPALEGQGSGPGDIPGDGSLQRKVGTSPAAATPAGSFTGSPLLTAVGHHLTNQLVQTTVYLPSYPLISDVDYLSKLLIGKLDRYYGGIFYAPAAYVKQLPFWWRDWRGGIPARTLLPITLNLLLIAAGISAAWRKDRSTAPLPLLAYGGYMLIFALIRRSGGRFLQEMDWVSSLYYAGGLVGVTRLGLAWRRGASPDWDPAQRPLAGKLRPAGWVSWLGTALLIAAVGSLPPLAELVGGTQYPEAAAAAAVEQLLGVNGGLTGQEQQQISTLLENGGGTALGKAYYPRFFEAGEDLVDVRPEVIGKINNRSAHPRLEFYLIGSDTVWVLIPAASLPGELPNGTEVLVTGCQQGGVLEAALAVVMESLAEPSRVYWRDSRPKNYPGCPPPVPEEN